MTPRSRKDPEEEKFRLKTVLDYRRKVRDGLQQDLAGIRHNLDEAEGRLYVLEELREKSMGELEARQMEGMTAPEAGIFYTFLHELQKEIGRQRVKVGQIQGQFDAKRDEVLKAETDARMMENLHARDVRVRRKDESRKEQRQMDEAGRRRPRELPMA